MEAEPVLEDRLEELREQTPMNVSAAKGVEDHNGSFVSTDMVSPEMASPDMTSPNTKIISNDVDALNQTDIEMVEDESDSSSSMEQTPKLNKSMEDFVRNSLRPLRVQKREWSKSPENNVPDGRGRDGGEDDMSAHNSSLLGLPKPISPIQNANALDVEEASMANTSLLAMSASRITVDDDEDDDDDDMVNINESLSKEEAASRRSSSSSNDWKQTPMKALEILHSVSRSLSSDPSTQSVHKKVLDFDAVATESINDEQRDQEEDGEEQQEGDEDVDMDSVATVEREEREEKSDTVENLFWESPKTKALEQDMISRSEEPSVEKAPDSISMTFGDGAKIAFKSVYSPSNPSMSTSYCAADTSPAIQPVVTRNRRKRPRSRSMTPEEVEKLCDKTTVIRQMFEREERRYEERTKKSTTTPSKKKKHKAGAVPDWNKIHNEQFFARQVDLKVWDRERKARTEKLFGNSTNSKLSTPGLRQRSKSMAAGKKPTRSAKTEKTKQRLKMIPSSNDHRFNHGTDSKMKRKTPRTATPYKHTQSNLTGPLSLSKKASAKPSFDITFTENSSIPEEKNCARSPAKAKKVPKDKLAFNPDNVRSRLFESTSSSKSKKRQMTPQVKTVKSGKKGSVIKSSLKTAVKKKDWSAVKSRIDTGRSSLSAGKDEANTVEKQGTKRKAIKRRLSWSAPKAASAQDNSSKNGEPATKKRRISAHPATARRWQ